MTLWLALLAHPALGQAPDAPPPAQDIAPALAPPKKKAKWEAKGKALDPYGLGNTKRKQELWPEAIGLLVDSVEVQPGCGQCLNSLALTLDGAKRYDDSLHVGRLLDQLYPDRSDGRRRISDTLDAAQRAQECVEATTRFLELEKADTGMWWRRNRFLLQLGKFDEAATFLDGAVAAGLSKENTACLQIQVKAAQGDPVAARELWATCDAGDNLDLRRYSEGWLAMSEGDSETAAKRLVLAGADDFARLTIAYLRLEQKKPDLALNLVAKINENPAWGWASDLHLAHAEALHGTGKDTEALDLLQKTLMADGWAEKHKSWTLDSVLLKARGQGWPSQVGLRAAALEVSLLAATGQADPAKAIYDQAVAVYGEKPELTSALPPPPAPPPAPAPGKKKQP
jgi:tetratricopeptide (TPR) repeat protein